MFRARWRNRLMPACPGCGICAISWGGRGHFWPFDGWQIPAGKSALVEVYPSLWSKGIPRADRTPDQHDAYVTAYWLRQVDRDGSLEKFLKPEMLPGQHLVAQIEGWILGVM